MRPLLHILPDVRIATLVLVLAPGIAHAEDVAAMQDPVPALAPEPPADSGGHRFFLWTDTSLSVLPYGTGFEVDPKEQTTFTIEHAHESKIGDFFGFIDFTHFHGAGQGPDETWYAEFGPRLSIGKISGREISGHLFRWSAFELKDVLLAMQYERGKDPDVAEAALVGLGLNLDVREAGFLGGLGRFNYVQVNFYGRSELTEGTRNGFHDMQVTMVASYPFKVGRADWLLDGYFDWVVGFGSEQWSYHLNPQLTTDLGALVWDVPKTFYAGVEIDLWWNKYKIPSSSAFDTNQQAISLLFKYHF
ncbi:outer membrane protein OmpK [Lysobacter sp. LF1]|uniref:Outer membrane protein OmpK n=1 Tax=Lysobacter stagni TaxID=3045172 RepID=A0ABT6XEL5_9GAMM|nr:outer membrane protein OmpK [Lysobacter sp. LF1]MDI9238587.1 outer membrane protein OmpK [Lysobacter sp. LF1]